MSGHSKWSTIKRQKAANDKARGKVFSRLIREITIAARDGGGDVESNPRLRTAVANARAQNMPNKNIDNAIARGTGKNGGESWEEMYIDGYGPGGVALLIEAITDNRNRTISDVRGVMNKGGGKLGEANSVAWMFDTVGRIIVERDKCDEETLMEAALEGGADDVHTQDDLYEVTTPLAQLDTVRDALTSAGIPVSSAEITKVPQNTVPVEGEKAQKLLKLINKIDDVDDVQNVYSNFDISESEMEKFNAQE